MSAVVGGAALAVVAAGVLAGAGVALLAGLRQGVRVLLDFLLAAGLLRLSVTSGWDDLGAIALVAGIRHVVGAHLDDARRGPRPLSASRPSPSTRRSARAGAGRARARRGSR